MSYWDYYERSQPRQAKGGIKSQGKRSGAENWWAKRWNEVLNSYGLGARLTRGRSYARSGQVLSIDIEPGLVHAKVQGSRPKPYSVTMKVKTFTAAEWDRVIEELAGQALFAARLLAGEMPQDIESVFVDAGLSLFPARMSDLGTDCSCPDYSNPCKHTAAVYILLGEEFDRDPFLIFTLRGMPYEALRTRLTGAGASLEAEETSALPPEPLTSDLTTFWHGRAVEQESPEAVRRPPVSAPLLRRLGSFPFWRAEIPLLEAVEPTYRAASDVGLNIFLGDDI